MNRPALVFQNIDRQIPELNPPIMFRYQNSIQSLIPLLVNTKNSTTLVSRFENPNGVALSGFFSCALRYQRFSELLAAATRHCAHVLRPRGCQTDKQAPQKCRESPCTTFQSRSRLYMDAVSMAKPSRRDVTGKEIYSTSYEPSKVRCALVFFFCSPSRGQIFGLPAQ